MRGLKKVHKQLQSPGVISYFRPPSTQIFLPILALYGEKEKWKEDGCGYKLPLEFEKCLLSLPQSLVKWIEDGVPEDPFLNPELMKNNPWVEKGKCILL